MLTDGANPLGARLTENLLTDQSQPYKRSHPSSAPTSIGQMNCVFNKKITRKEDRRKSID